MSKMQREKGANAEREVAHILLDHGYKAKRGQVFNGQPDIVSEDFGMHIEVKRQETTKLGEWFRQSEEAAKEENLPPCVIHRRSREPWLITMKLEDLLDWR